jgi:hypothetical protein
MKINKAKLNSEDKKDIIFFVFPVLVFIIINSISSVLIHLHLLQIMPSILLAVNLYTFSCLLLILPIGILFILILDKRIKERQSESNNELKEGQ